MQKPLVRLMVVNVDTVKSIYPYSLEAPNNVRIGAVFSDQA